MELLFTLLMLLLFARIGGEVAERANQSSLVGEIVGGLLIGPTFLGAVKPDGGISELLQLGGILLLFLIGLNTRLDEIQEKLFDSIVLGVAGQLTAFIVIMLSSHFILGTSYAVSAFLGALFAPSSTAVAVRTLVDMNRLYTRTGRMIMSLSIVDDFVGIVVLAIAAAFFSNATLDTGGLWKMILTVVGFITVLTTVGSKVIPPIFKFAEKMIVKESMISFSLIICFAIAMLANQLGIAVIIGAFLAGVTINKSPFTTPTILPKLSAISYGFFVPMFFANIGVSASLANISSNVWTFIILAVIVVAGKFVPLLITAENLGYKKNEAFAIAAGMIPRAEYTFILASVGLGMKIIDVEMFSVIVLLTIGTIFAGQVLMKRGFENGGDEMRH